MTGVIGTVDAALISTDEFIRIKSKHDMYIGTRREPFSVEVIGFDNIFLLISSLVLHRSTMLSGLL